MLHLSPGTTRRDVICSRFQWSCFQAGHVVSCGAATNGSDDSVTKPTAGQWPQSNRYFTHHQPHTLFENGGGWIIGSGTKPLAGSRCRVPGGVRMVCGGLVEPQNCTVLLSWYSQRCDHFFLNFLNDFALEFWTIAYPCDPIADSPVSLIVSILKSLLTRSQHSQECKDPRWHCLCYSWHGFLTFDPKSMYMYFQDS